MNALASALYLLRELKDTLVVVNRTVAHVDPLYVRVFWAGSVIGAAPTGTL